MYAYKWLQICCGMLAIAFSSPGYTCTAPVGKFCVDFFRGTQLQGKPVATAKTPVIRYNWKTRSPVSRLRYDDFSARWRGQFDFNEGEYEFLATADDGVRILIDGKTVLDQWQNGSGIQHRVQVALSNGRHLVEAEYFEAKGNANISVSWKETDSAVKKSGDKSGASDDLNQVGPSNPKIVPGVIKNNRNQAPIGVNLGDFTYSDPSVPFKDLVMQSGLIGVIKNGSSDPCPEQPTFDDQGYPHYLPDGCKFRLVSVFHILNDKFWPRGTTPYRSGHYVLLYKGKGQIRLSWDASKQVQKGAGRIEFDVPQPSAGLMVEVTTTDPADPVRDLHIVHESDEATFLKQPFNETWLNLLKPFSVLRFKDWGKLDWNSKVYEGSVVSYSDTSIQLPAEASKQPGRYDGMVAVVDLGTDWPQVFIERYDAATRTLSLKTPINASKSNKTPYIYIYNYLNRTWDGRAKPTTLGQNSDKGVAFETMIQLANLLDVDPWFSIPTAADDHFVQQLAQLLKSQLKPHLKAYIEYSNETWNSIYLSSHYANAKAAELHLKDTLVPGDAWQAYRAVEIFKIFNRVFGEADLRTDRQQSRLIRVLTSQTAWPSRSVKVMDWQMPNGGQPTAGHAAHEYADVWAATTYFYLQKGDSLEAPMDELFSKQIANIDDMFGTDSKPGIIRQLLSEARQRGLQFVTYEAGTHVLAPAGRDDLVAKLAAVNKDERMKGVYAQLLENWNQLYKQYGPESVGVWMQFNHIGRYSNYGYWGLLQSVNQDPTTAPKFQAITDFVSGNQ